jgi:DNA adenine methylase
MDTAATNITPDRDGIAAAARRDNDQRLALKPPIKYPGGKRFLLPRLRRLIQDVSCTRFVEPFAGGLSVSLGLAPERALLNDLNPHVINFYNWVKKGLAVDIPMRNNRAFYYRLRERFNDLIRENRYNSREAAEIFYYLNRTGYNGLVRFNKSGLFNVPFGVHKTILYKRDFSEYRSLMQGWELRCGDFCELTVRDGDLLYVDPPFDVEFRAYATGGFGWEDQVRLVEWLAELTCPVIISNQATERIIQLYRKHGYRLSYIKAPRMISCNGDRTPAREVIAIRNL